MSENSGGETTGSSRVILRPIAAGDQDEFLELARAGADLHRPSYSRPTTREEFQDYLTR